MRTLLGVLGAVRLLVYFEAERDYTRPGLLNELLVYRPRRR